MSVKLFFARLVYKLLKRTVRIEVWGHESIAHSLEKEAKVVVASPHFCLLPVLLYWPHKPASVITSQSRDGDLVAGVLANEGFGILRGSSNRGGVSALRGLLGHLREYRTIGIAWDGPKGPPLVPKPGVALCARLTQAEVYFAYALPRNRLFIKLPSWDRFFLPLPGCRVDLVFEALGTVGGSQNSFLKNLEDLAALRCGHWYV